MTALRRGETQARDVSSTKHTLPLAGTQLTRRSLVAALLQRSRCLGDDGQRVLFTPDDNVA